MVCNTCMSYENDEKYRTVKDREQTASTTEPEVTSMNGMGADVI